MKTCKISSSKYKSFTVVSFIVEFLTAQVFNHNHKSSCHQLPVIVPGLGTNDLARLALIFVEDNLDCKAWIQHTWYGMTGHCTGGRSRPSSADLLGRPSTFTTRFPQGRSFSPLLLRRRSSSSPLCFHVSKCN